MNRVLSILALVLVLSACSTTPYEPVYIDDQGGYYIAETLESNGYYVYTPVMMRNYGFDPWWYDRFYYSPYYGFYHRYYWPYYAVGWHPWYYGGYGYAPLYAWGGGYGGLGYGGMGYRGGWVHRPATLPANELLNENGDLPSPISPARLNPGLEDTFDRLQREHELMQRGRMAYRQLGSETPINRRMLVKNPGMGSYKLNERPVKIDQRKLRTLKPRTWPETRSVLRAGSMSPMAPSVRSAAPISSRPAPVMRRGPARIDRY